VKKTIAAKAAPLLAARQPSPRALLAEDAVFYDAAGDYSLELRRALGADYARSPAVASSRLHFVNSPRLLEILAFKTLALAELAARGIRVPRSIGIVAGKRVAFGAPAASSRAEKFVSKIVARGGVALHRGDGIAALSAFREPKENELVQEFVWPPNEFNGYVKDLRVVLVGNKVAARYARRAPKPLPHAGVASEKQFLTNAARGGIVEEFPRRFEDNATEMAFAARKALVEAGRKFGDSRAALDFCAVDFLVDEAGALFVCEVEPAPDLRASAQATRKSLDELALLLRDKSRRLYGFAQPRRVYVNGLNYLAAGIIKRLPAAAPLVTRAERALVKKFLVSR
jgi:glutathione synthase/RimK-type ligase-like ATP-grasp enzyme